MVATTTRPPTSPRRRGSRISWTVVTLLSLAIAGYFSGQYANGNLEQLAATDTGLAPVYADRAFGVQIAFWVHITSAGLALALGPFQFAKALRRRYPTVHRWVGRTYVVAIAFASTSGLVMALFNSAGFVGFFGFGALSVLWGWTTWRGYRAVRMGDLASHQAWMIRSFALTFAAPTLRLWLGILIGFQVLSNSLFGTTFDDYYENAYPVVPFMCWLPNIVVAENMIRRRNLPGLRFSASPTSRRMAKAAAEA